MISMANPACADCGHALIFHSWTSGVTRCLTCGCDHFAAPWVTTPAAQRADETEDTA